jgi:UDP-GlcNAc:undecaprenyl-phosphate GlcNAc-1-phosphate transferase
LLGGIAIWLAIVIPYVLRSSLDFPILGLTLVFLTGLVDDIRSIGPIAKTIGVSLGILLPIVMSDQFTPSYAIIAYFWILLLVNSVNLLDNINGLATLSAIGSCLFIASVTGDTALVLLAGALAGFLPYNFPKARIFMGDAGSMTIGYWVGSNSLLLVETLSYPALGALLFLLAPLADTTFVTVTRLARGQKISIGGKDHISHRVATLLGSETYSVLAIITLQLFISVGTIWVFRNATESIPLYTIAVIVLVTIGCRMLFTRTSAGATPDAA